MSFGALLSSLAGAVGVLPSQVLPRRGPRVAAQASGEIAAPLPRPAAHPARGFPRRAARRLAPGLLLTLVPLGAFAMHLYPGLQGQALAARQAAPMQEIGGWDAGPPRRLATPPGVAAGATSEPTNSTGWIRLAGALGRLHRYDEAAQAYAKAADLTGQPALLAAHGEALILASGGTVTPKARHVLLQVLEKQPDEIRSRYYLGLAEIQAGRTQHGLQMWSDLVADPSMTGVWRESFRRHVRDVVAQYGIDPIKPAFRSATRGIPSPGSSRRDIEMVK